MGVFTLEGKGVPFSSDIHPRTRAEDFWRNHMNWRSQRYERLLRKRELLNMLPEDPAAPSKNIPPDDFYYFPVGKVACFGEGCYPETDLNYFSRNCMGTSRQLVYIQKDDVDLIMSRAAAVRIPKSNSGVGGENTADYRFVRRLGSCFSSEGIVAFQSPTHALCFPHAVAKCLARGGLSCVAFPRSEIPRIVTEHFGMSRRQLANAPVLPDMGVPDGDLVGTCTLTRQIIHRALHEIRKLEPGGDYGDLWLPHDTKDLLDSQLKDAAYLADSAAQLGAVRDLLAAGGTKRRYTLLILLTSLQMATCVRSTHGEKFKESLQNAVKLIFGSAFAAHVCSAVEQAPYPSTATLWYTKVKFETMICAWSREEIQRLRTSGKAVSRYVLADSSPSSGIEALLTRSSTRVLPSLAFCQLGLDAPAPAVAPATATSERAQRQNDDDEFDFDLQPAAAAAEGAAEGDGRGGSVADEWSELVLPVGGLGNMSIADKTVAFIHQVALVAGDSPDAILEWCGEHYGVLTDEGAEDLLSSAPISALNDWLTEQGQPRRPEFSPDKVAEHLRDPATQHRAFLFPISLGIKGTRHGGHNIAKRLSQYLFEGTHRDGAFNTNTAPIDDNLKEGLKAAGKVLAQRLMRNRVLATIWKDVPQERLPSRKPGPNTYSKLRYPAKTITEWRWGDCIAVIVPLVVLRSVVEEFRV